MENFDHQLDNKKYVDNDNSNTNYVSTVERINELERNELIEELKSETVPPIEGVKDMKEISESILMEKVSWFFNEKIDENIKKWNWDEVLCSWEEIKQIKINPEHINRDIVKLQDIKQNQEWNEIFESNSEILDNKKIESFKTDEEFIDEVKWYFARLWTKEVTLKYKHKEIISWNTIKKSIEDKDEANLRAQLYRLFSEKNELYQEFLDSIWASKGFILWVEDRWNRWWSETRGWHMWVDYNLPKWTPISSIYDWTVVAKRSGRKIMGNETVIKHINEIYWENWKLDNILIIEHQIGWKTFYSLYIHITDKDSLQIGSIVEKWQEIWKIDWYETNGQWQPHLHFTIMTNLDNRPILSWYVNKNTVCDDETNQGLQENYERYSKDMIDPSKVYN